MRGKSDRQQAMMFVVSPEDMIPAEHPIRRIKALVDDELAAMSRVFDRMYSNLGRPSVPPEQLLKGSLLMALFSVRSERQLCEQLRYNFLFRWFLDLGVNDAPFDATSFTQNRQRLLDADVGRRFFERVVDAARREQLLSTEHFTVDGTLIEAHASMKSFRPKDATEPDRDDDPTPGSRNPDMDFHGQRRRNATHQSTTDPEARLARKGDGKEAKLCFSAHILMENRHGLCVDIAVAPPDGHAEVDQAVAMIRRYRRHGHRVTSVGADKGYDRGDFAGPLRRLHITPHTAARSKGSSVDRRTTRHETYRISQWCRKKVEEIFGWVKTIGGLRRTRYRGVARTGLCAYWIAAAYNLVRMSKLLAHT